jgi:hypothetical protein
MTFSIAFSVEIRTELDTKAVIGAEVTKLLLPGFTMLTVSKGAFKTVAALTTVALDDGVYLK